MHFSRCNGLEVARLLRAQNELIQTRALDVLTAVGVSAIGQSDAVARLHREHTSQRPLDLVRVKHSLLVTT